MTQSSEEWEKFSFRVYRYGLCINQRQIHLKSITQTGFIHSSQMTKLITNCIELKICNFIYIFHIYFKPSFIRDREKKITNICCRKQVAKISYRKRTHKGIEVGNPNCENKLSFILISCLRIKTFVESCHLLFILYFA